MRSVAKSKDTAGSSTFGYRERLYHIRCRACILKQDCALRCYRPPQTRRPLVAKRLDRCAVRRESAACLSATELVLSAALTGTRCVWLGSRVGFAGRRSRGRLRRGATWRSGSRTPPVHPWEHLLVSPDHGVDDGTPKIVELFPLHVEGWRHFADPLIPLVVR